MLPILTDIKNAVTALTQRPLNVRANHTNGADRAREPSASLAARDPGPPVSPRARGKDVALRAIAAITATLQAVDALRARFDNAGCVE
jgi:hypothetical protein